MEAEGLAEVEKLNLFFPGEVVQAIQEILPSDDPFDAADFDAVGYINMRFPAEQSLHHIDDVLEEMRLRATATDSQIRDVVRSLASADQDGRTSLLHAQEAIAELFARFQDIKERAGESEERVKEITRDIKQLDTAKRNLTASITTLNHLQMLVEGTQKLEALQARREYGEVASLLQGVLEVMEHLQRYRHIPQVTELARQVEQIRSGLEKQILDDFERAFHGPASRQPTPTRALAEACLVVNQLEPRVRRSIIEEVVKTQLAEYEVLFAGQESDGWLSKVELRRRWFLKTALEFEKTLAAMFPPSWQVPARLALSFCDITRTQLAKAMELRTQDVDVATLLHAHKVMSELESVLVRKYAGFQERTRSLSTASCTTTTTTATTATSPVNTNPFIEEEQLEASNPFSTDTQAPSPSGGGGGETVLLISPFHGAICRCFKPYLKVYIDHVDRRLSDQVEKFSGEIRAYRFEHIDAEESNVVPCCGELFTIYKGELGGLVEVMQRHLREFCGKVLRAALPRGGGGGSGGGGGAANIPLPKDLNMKEISAVLAQVQTLWREGEGGAQKGWGEEEVRRVCSVLVSAEYCEEMTGRLEAKDLFHAVLAQCITLLVSRVEGVCEAALVSIPKQSWVLEQTGDHSPYVTALAHHLAAAIPPVRHNLHTSRKYFTRFCDKLAAAILNKFVQQVYKCRPITSVGCEQLLLDCHALKAVMLQMPVVGSQVRRDPPQTYTRMVTRGMARAELVLQVVMGEYHNNTALVDKFMRLLPDATIADFQKVVEMRGVKERAALLELYRQRTTTTTATTTPATSPPPPTTDSSYRPAAPVPAPPATPSPEHDMSKIARLERMLKSRRLIS
ncbi:hypothetical protein O3P69_019277 [Scylla paramamosain]|uniref:Vacuolar protein sorting-associated protein 53 homolog n=1 Tax=Scylla paramamosain TaxID=85552 RepID=A0AAW0SVZ4_SCYPA